MKRIIAIFVFMILLSSVSFAHNFVMLRDYTNRDTGMRTRAQYGKIWVKEYYGTVERIDTSVNWDKHIIIKTDDNQIVKVKIDKLTDYRPSKSALREGIRINVKVDSEGYASFIEVGRYITEK